MYIEITEDSPSAGRIPADGSPVQFPAVDVFGQPYEDRRHLNRRAVRGSATLFVLVPPVQDTDFLDVALAGTRKAEMTAAPEATDEPRRARNSHDK